MNTKEIHTLSLDMFASEQSSLEYLKNLRWKGGIPTCPQCGNQHMNYLIKSRNFYKCSKCTKQFSIKTGTVMEHSRLPISKWMKAIYYMTVSKGISSNQLATYLEIPQRTAWGMLDRLRCALKNMNDDIVLEGEIEIDEVYDSPDAEKSKMAYVRKKLFERKMAEIYGDEELLTHLKKGATLEEARKLADSARKKASRRGNRRPVEVYADNYYAILGMKERGGRLVLKKLGSTERSVTGERLTPCLIQHISLDATIYTDFEGAYRPAELIFHQRLKINHSKRKYVEGNVHTNSIESCWSHFKGTLKHIHKHVKFKNLDKYMVEFTYRHNGRHQKPKELFDSFMPYFLEEKKKMEEIGDPSVTWVAAA